MRELPKWYSGKESACQCRRYKETWVPSLDWEDPLRRKLQSAPVLLPGESQEQRSLVGYSPWVCKESDMTEQLSTHMHTTHTYVCVCVYTYIYIYIKHKITTLTIQSVQFSKVYLYSYATNFQNFSILQNWNSVSIKQQFPGLRLPFL